MADIRPYIAECVEIYKICKKYGYGNVMEWASALWRRDMRSKGYTECGCFVPKAEIPKHKTARDLRQPRGSDFRRRAE